MNPARQAAIHAGLPVKVPAMTVNRVCGSGAQAIVSAAQEIVLGAVDVAVAGGMENMDLAPYLVARGRWGYRMGDGQLYDSVLRDGLNDAFSDEPSGWHTEDLVREFQVEPRGAGSMGAALAAALQRGPGRRQVQGGDRPGRGAGPQRARPRSRPTSTIGPDTTLEALAALKPAFRKDGTITAGNAPGAEQRRRRDGARRGDMGRAARLEPVARLVSYGIAAVEPGMFGLGPIPPSASAGARRLEARDVERIEINEAFAAIAIVVARELGLPEDIVNVEGGAIAHGHPIGATGAVLTTRLMHSMRRDGFKRGIVTLCIGGGQGIALALETIA